MGFYSPLKNALLYAVNAPLRPFGRHKRLVWEVVFELALIVLFLKVYNHVRNQFGSRTCSPQFALKHALQVIRVEQVLGMFWEQTVQTMVLKYPLFISFWNVFYGFAHTAVTGFVVVYLFVFKPAAYQRCRTIFLIMNVFALAGYAGYPLMPPRLVNDCSDRYGGCLKEPQFNFVDTMQEFGGLWSWKSKVVSRKANHYAAMPSMHAGYSTWCSTSMYKHSQSRVLKGLAVVYPLLTLYCITVTANHYPLDAVFGLLALFLAMKVAVYIPEVGRGAASALAKQEEEQPSISLKASVFPLVRNSSLSEWTTFHRHHSSCSNLAHLGSGDVETGEHKGEPGVETVKDHIGRPASTTVKKR